MTFDRYLPMDEEGYFLFDGQRVEDKKIGAELLSQLRVVEKNRYQTLFNDQSAWVECFDAPLVVRHLVPPGGSGAIQMELPYGLTMPFSFENLNVDEWDRFHGKTSSEVPFVLSRAAQVEFFDLLESFDDDSVIFAGHRYEVPPHFFPHPPGDSANFWTERYREGNPGWELGGENPVLQDVMPQLKLSKSRILVLGSGAGHDAAYLARLGHNVTGVDFSEEAIQRARAAYGTLDNLEFVQKDIFALPEAWTNRFDLVFEHTCYCAISPDRRNELVNVWRRVLHSHGHLLGIFFVTEMRHGPPFGGTEWEVRQRLRKYFDFLFWTRWRRSIENRKAKELVVYARKI